MTKCFKVIGYGATPDNTRGQHLQSNGIQYPSWVRANTATVTTITVADGYYAGCLASALVLDGIIQSGYGAAIEISEDPDNPNCPVADKYDCINGTCTKKAVYNTPGLYASLEDCQAVCANGGACASGKKCVDPTTFCPDGKVCIDQDEFASIENLVSKINSEVC